MHTSTKISNYVRFLSLLYGHTSLTEGVRVRRVAEQVLTIFP